MHGNCIFNGFGVTTSLNPISMLIIFLAFPNKQFTFTLTPGYFASSAIFSIIIVSVEKDKPSR